VAGSAFTFGEGTLVTCWHCVKQPLGSDEFYGIAVRRGNIESPYEFCSIDNLERDHNGADLALGHIDWMPGRGRWPTIPCSRRASSSERRSRRKLGHVRDNIEVPTCRDEAVVFRAHKLGKADRFLDRTLKSRPHVGH
jgi:hypothetical protein